MAERGALREDYDVTYKVVLVGESGVGKTSLLTCLTDNRFSAGTIATIGIDFRTEVFDVDGARVRLEIWDTAGQERFRTFTKSHFRGAKGLLLVFDVTRIETFKQLNYWINSIERLIDSDECPKLVVGNKVDMVLDRQVTREMGVRLAEANYERGYEETSCKTNTNVHATFHQLAAALVETYHPLLTDAFKGKVTDYNKPQVRRDLHKVTVTEKRDSIVLTQRDLDLQPGRRRLALDPRLATMNEDRQPGCCN